MKKSFLIFFICVFFGCLILDVQKSVTEHKKAQVTHFELLIHTSDTFMFSAPETTWTQVQIDLDRSSNMKQGFVQRVEPAGYEWGTLELDPKRFLIVTIPIAQYDSTWLEQDFRSGKEFADRKHWFALDKLLTRAELDSLKAIPFNKPAKNLIPIRKTIPNISTIVDTIDWGKRPVRIKLHGSAGTFTVRPSGSSPAGTYTSLQTAVETEAADISAGGDDATFLIEHNGTNWSDDTGNWDVDGWTMGTNEMFINAQGAAKHDGTPSTTAAHRIVHVTQGFDIEIPNVTVEGLQFDITNVGIEISGAGDVFVIDDVLIFGQSGVSGNQAIFIVAGGGTISNCVINRTKAVETGSEGIFKAGSGTVNVRNSTIGGFNDGIERSAGTLTVTNTAVFNSDDDFDGTITIDFCASDDVDGTNSVDISPGTETTDWDNTFTDYVNDNLSVKDAASVIENAGTDLSGSGISDDIIGTSRPQDGTYDIGAFEFIVSAITRRKVLF